MARARDPLERPCGGYAAPSCAVGPTPVAAPTYVSSGVGGKPTVQFSGVNVQVVNGSGKTTTVNGTGNLVVGYDENPGKQTGSRNLILGTRQAYASFGGLIAVYDNAITAAYASASGGTHNHATGGYASVSGGYGGTASGSSAPCRAGTATRPPHDQRQRGGHTLVAVISRGCGPMYDGGDATGTSSPSDARCDVAFGKHDLSHCTSVVQPRPSLGYLNSDTMASVAPGELIGISFSNLPNNTVAVMGRHTDGSYIPAGQMGEFKIIVHC